MNNVNKNNRVTKTFRKSLYERLDILAALEVVAESKSIEEFKYWLKQYKNQRDSYGEEVLHILGAIDEFKGGREMEKLAIEEYLKLDLIPYHLDSICENKSSKKIVEEIIKETKNKRIKRLEVKIQPSPMFLSCISF